MLPLRSTKKRFPNNLQHFAQRLTQYYVYLPLVIILVIGTTLRVQGIVNSLQFSNQGAPFTDDSFYYFSLGRNLAHGEPRVDALNSTTGFQPLWGFLVAVPYLVSPEYGIEGVQVLGILIGAGTCIVIYRLTLHLSQSSWLAVINAGLWFLAPQTLLHNLNGMETSLVVLFALLILDSFILYSETRTRNRLMWLGLASGLGFMARVDLALMMSWMILAVLVFLPLREEKRVRTGLWWGIWALIPVIPWVLFTTALGRSPMPESGEAVRTIILVLGDVHPPELTWHNLTTRDPIFGEHYNYYVNNLELIVKEFGRQVYLTRLFEQDTVNAGNVTSAFRTLVIMLVLATLGALLSRLRVLLLVVCVFILWAISMMVAYAFYVLTQWYFARYMLPLAEVLAILFLAIWFRVVSERSSITRWIVWVLLAIGSLGLLNAYRQDYEDSLVYSWVLDGGKHVRDDAFETTVAWVNENLDSEARMGAFNSGLIGYHTDAPVINLDGKVNSGAHNAIEARQMWRYVCETDIRFIIDWPVMVHFLLKQRSMDWQEANLREVATFQSQSINPISVFEVERNLCP